MAQLTIFRAGPCRDEDFVLGRWDVIGVWCPFPAAFSSLASLLLAQRLRLPTWLPDGCLLLSSLFPSPGVACCLSSFRDWWDHLESLELALVTEG